MRRWSLLSASSFALLVGTAHAAPPDDASSPGADVAEAPARDEFERGKIALDEGRWAEACALFESSLHGFPSSSAEIKVAGCREHDGRLVEAVRAYEAVLGRNDAAAPTERATLTVSPTDDGLTVTIDAPFHDDPAPSEPPGPRDGLWAFEVVDADAVPREWMIVNEQAIGAAVRAGLRTIPGVRIFERPRVG